MALPGLILRLPTDAKMTASPCHAYALEAPLREELPEGFFFSIFNPVILFEDVHDGLKELRLLVCLPQLDPRGLDLLLWGKRLGRPGFGDSAHGRK
ncbi:TPA: hypothetical protein UN285_003037 [Stenotrophomonas maltophilia]|nr:hypothetical protein [Stenotrophomonas maltophilia]HEL4811837.1 hypothetical protein [Stenotrophomonas maltophilia]